MDHYPKLREEVERIIRTISHADSNTFGTCGMISFKRTTHHQRLSGVQISTIDASSCIILGHLIHSNVFIVLHAIQLINYLWDVWYYFLVRTQDYIN